uniref:Uncharacterized protein n=1 Tax=Populus trichocarpa TaxID=3694 RepID=A9P8N9_POPTR|nr:unknown [Populus trichocarpa]
MIHCSSWSLSYMKLYLQFLPSWARLKTHGLMLMLTVGCC